MPRVGAAPVRLEAPPLAELQQRRSDKWAGYAPGVISATIAEMDFPIAEPIAEALHAAIAQSDLGYPPATEARLAEAFAGFAKRRMGWTVDPGQVRLVPDVMVGLLDLARLLAGPERSVAVASPAYPPFLAEPPYTGLQVREVLHRPDGSVDLGALAATFAAGVRVFILANPHNPTGRVLPHDELRRIADLAAEHEAWVLADEIHAPLVLPGAEHVPWLTVSESARTHGFALTSASKAFNVAGLKAAVCVTASAEARAVVERLPPQSDHAGLLGVVAAEAAFTAGDDWLNAVLQQLDENRALLGRLLARQLPDVNWTPPQAGYLAWLDCRSLGLGDSPAAVLLDRARVALSPGLDYGASGAGWARLNFGTSPELLSEIIDRVAVAVGEGSLDEPSARG